MRVDSRHAVEIAKNMGFRRESKGPDALGKDLPEENKRGARR